LDNKTALRDMQAISLFGHKSALTQNQINSLCLLKPL